MDSLPAQYNSRDEVPLKYKWNQESMFASDEDWGKAAAELGDILAQFEQYRGRLGESPQTLLEALEVFQNAVKHTMSVLVYAYVRQAVENTDPTAARLWGQAQATMGRLMAGAAFLDPELISIGQDKLERWMDEEPPLAFLRFYVEDLFRKQAHVLSPELEQALGMLIDPFMGTATTRSILVDGDLKFLPARSSDGRELPVSQGNLSELLASPDREVRRTAWENYMDAHLEFKNTLANNLVTSVKQNVYMSRVRRYPSSLEYALFENNIPTEVVRNTLDTFRRRLPTWRRYWRLRKQGLGVAELQPYDIWAPLTEKGPEIPYEQTLDWVCAGLAPLGEEYLETVRKGLREQRWVDVYPTPGKSSAEFSTGAPGSHPFIIMNYDNTIFSLSTLAHEMGHSMHSYLSWQNQPLLYSRYSTFAAEVASNFNQALVRAYLLETNSDLDFQISVLEEALSNFHRYFFIMPILELFELEVHERVERGMGLSAQDLNQLMADLFAEGYGDELSYDRDRVGITWATFSHLYQDFYVFQYTTGISGAHALAGRVLKEEPGAVDSYLKFLKAGGSMHPLEALRMAGIDLATPQPVEDTFDILDGLLDRLENSLQKAGRGK